MRALPRATLDSFRGGLRGFGFADVYKGRLAIQGFDRFAETGANCARVAFVPHHGKIGYYLPDEQLDALLWTITELQRRGAHTIPLMAFQDENEWDMVWRDERARQSIIELVWPKVIRATKGWTAIAGVDLGNEPKMFRNTDGAIYWDKLTEPLVAKIRSIDPDRICITSTWPGGICQTNPEWGEWIRHIPGTVLTAHNYAPFPFTHQGGLVDWVGEGEPWDAYMHTQLIAQHTALMWLRDHSLKTGQPVWIGESSARQDRAGGAEWVRHHCQLLEGFRMSGSHHYFIGPDVWHPSDATMEALKDWFSRGWV